MDTSVKLFLVAIWCFILFHSSVHSQHFVYKHKDVNHYEIKNGKYRLIPTTTRAPSLMETFFPWTGNAYNSVRTPEEDAAILNSLSDPDPSSSNPTSTSTSNDNGGLMSWFSIPGFGSSANSIPNGPQSMPMNPPPHMMRPNLPPPPVNYNGNFPIMGAASQNEPVVVPPPGAENQSGIFPAPSPPSLPMQQQAPSSQYSPPPPSYLPNEIRNNVHPTFQFHQQVKDSIPIPTPSLSNLGQPMFPYPYSAGGNMNFGLSTTEKSTSILDVISNYFTFGKRSDLEEGSSSSQDGIAIEGRSMDNSADEYEAEEDDEELKEVPAMTDDDDPSASPPSTDDKPFPCPKGGIWRWNGDVCIAVGPVPIWACRPNDLIVSGKIAICRNKIYFSPKVINKSSSQRVN